MKLKTAITIAVLFIAAWLPRVLALDAFVTIDERKWLARSANFYQALNQGDLANTFQREHPGVTVMWAGLLGLLQKFPTYAQEAPGQFTWEREHIEAWLYANSNITPLELLAAGRWWIVLAISMTITACFFPLRRLLGPQVAAFATLFIAWTPFHIALSRQLHPDGLSSSLIFLALLTFLAWLYGDTKKPNFQEKTRFLSVDGYLILSGIIMGLAWLTKTPAIFLVPIGAALIVQRCFQKSSSTLHLASFTLWGIIATATFILLWPAMWLEPIGTLTRMATEMSDYVSRHVNPNYFMGQPTSDPGLIFYPVAWLFRSTPIAWIGLTAAALCRWRCKPPFDQPRTNQIVLALLIFALLFTAGMSIGAKKFDRYILPTFLALNVIGSVGLWHFFVRNLREVAKNRLDAQSIGRHLPKVGHKRAYLASLIAPFILVLLHGILGFVHYPYYLTYYNPFTGGSSTAPAILFTGWGDGLDSAAEWLNQQGGEEVENLRVASWYADGPFSYFFKGQATSISYGSPLFWLGTDYAVLYVNQWQRQIPSAEMIDYFFAQEPAHVVRSGGLELARVYNLQETLLPDFLDIGKESAADFGGQIRLAAYRIDQQQAMLGDQFQATFYLQSLAPMNINYNVLVRLVDRAGNELWRDEGWPWGAPTAQWPIREVRPDGHTVAIPDEAVTGLYRFLLSFYDPATLDSLPIMDARSGQPIDGAERPVALLQVGAPPPIRETLDPQPHFGTSFALDGFTLPDQTQSGEVLSLQLQWQSLQRMPTDYTAFVHIVDANGTLAAQWDQPPLAGFAPTHLWTPGQALLDSYEIPLPEDLPAGRYTVRVGLYTLEAGRLPVIEGEQVVGDFVALGGFDVVGNSE